MNLQNTQTKPSLSSSYLHHAWVQNANTNPAFTNSKRHGRSLAFSVCQELHKRIPQTSTEQQPFSQWSFSLPEVVYVLRALSYAFGMNNATYINLKHFVAKQIPSHSSSTPWCAKLYPSKLSHWSRRKNTKLDAPKRLLKHPTHKNNRLIYGQENTSTDIVHELLLWWAAGT